MTRQKIRTLLVAGALAAISLSSLPAQDSGIKALKERERKVKAVVQKAMAATVAIDGVRQPASGSGVIVSKDGLILTAAHVTAAAGQSLSVTFPDGRRVAAKSLGANNSRDAGMVQITEEGEWPFVEMAKPDDVTLGEWCVALGHPGGYDPNRTPPVRLGRVWTKRFLGMIGSDCTLVGGDSGGPLFDLDGKLIGIHSSIGGQLSENRHVPMDAYTDDWDDIKGGKLWGSQGAMMGQIDPDRPAMGVQLDTDSEDGVKVIGLSDSSPAGKAGIEVGDRIVKVGSREVKTFDEMIGRLEKLKVGEKVKIGVVRGGEDKEFEVELGRLGKLWSSDRRPRPDEPEEPVESRPSLGIAFRFEAESPVVLQVLPDSAAQKAGVEVGDVILQIDGDPIETADQVVENIRSRKPGDTIKLRLKRGGEEKELEATLGAAAG